MAVQRLMERNSFDLCIRRGLILMGVGALMIFGAAVSQVFAWGGPSHSALATKVLDDPAVSPFISEFGIDANSVKSWTSEPPDAWHHPGWSMLQARGYLGIHNDMDWTSLSETTRLRYLIHIAADSGVPVGHSPARCMSIHWEAQLEGQVVVGQLSFGCLTGYYHESTGYSETFTGTYSQILTKFYTMPSGIRTRKISSVCSWTPIAEPLVRDDPGVVSGTGDAGGLFSGETRSGGGGQRALWSEPGR